jgi:hypothetical protein
MRRQIPPDTLKYALLSGVKVQNGKGAILGLDLQSIADRPVVQSFSPLAKCRRSATSDQGLEKLLLFVRALRARHGDLGLVWEEDANWPFGYECATACEWRVYTMSCVAEAFQHR